MKRTQPLVNNTGCVSFSRLRLRLPSFSFPSSCILHHLQPSSTKLKLGSTRQAISLKAVPIIHRQRRWPSNRSPPLSNKTTKSASSLVLNVTRLRRAADGPHFQGRLSYLHPSHHTDCSAYHVPTVQRQRYRSRSSGPQGFVRVAACSQATKRQTPQPHVLKAISLSTPTPPTRTRHRT